jgi:hypothetical protein
MELKLILDINVFLFFRVIRNKTHLDLEDAEASDRLFNKLIL